MRLEVDNLELSLGGLHILAGVSLAADRGVHGLIGPNGSGKSTLLNVLCGIVVPQSGSVCLDGERLDGLSPTQVARRGVARVFQSSRLVSGLTVLENLMVDRSGASDSASAQAAMNALEQFGVGGLAARSVTQLSFGQARLVELARALVLRPRLLLLDEPALGLNPPRVDALASRLRRLVEENDMIVLLVEHVLRLVADACDEVTVLDAGRVCARGTPAEVLVDARVMASYGGASAAGER